MKLAIVISHPIQHFSPQYASLAKVRGLTVKVFFASALGFKKYLDPNFKKEISWGNLRMDEYDHVFLNGDHALPADKNLDAPGLDNALTEFQPDVVLLHGYFQKFQRRAHRWARKNKIKTAYIADSERRQHHGGIKEYFKKIYVQGYFDTIDLFLTVGNANEEYYSYHRVPEKKIVRMHFSIDLQSYEKAYQDRKTLAKTVREKHGLGAQDIIFSVVGKLVPWKNQSDIIDAMILLEEKGMVSNLFVIGSGEDMDRLKKNATHLKKSRVIFPGFITPEELPGYYAASDIYIHPAAIEPHSLAISEAIFMGTPAIISDRCGSYGESDDVQIGKNGFVYPCGNISALGDAIDKLVHDRSLRTAFGEYSHRTAAAFQERSHGGFVQDMKKKLGR